MPMPVAIALAYLSVNLAAMLWLERQRAAGRTPPGSVAALSAVLRYGPPVAGGAYLMMLTGDWLFVGFVIGFFAGAFYLMDGLLAYTDLSHGTEAMRSGWDDRRVGDRAKADRDRA